MLEQNKQIQFKHIEVPIQETATSLFGHPIIVIGLSCRGKTVALGAKGFSYAGQDVNTNVSFILLKGPVRV